MQVVLYKYIKLDKHYKQITQNRQNKIEKHFQPSKDTYDSIGNCTKFKRTSTVKTLAPEFYSESKIMFILMTKKFTDSKTRYMGIATNASKLVRERLLQLQQ